jgi:hypothetical protein
MFPFLVTVIGDAMTTYIFFNLKFDLLVHICEYIRLIRKFDGEGFQVSNWHEIRAKTMLVQYILRKMLNDGKGRVRREVN